MGIVFTGCHADDEDQWWDAFAVTKGYYDWKGYKPGFAHMGDAAIGMALVAFFLGVRLMLATWPVCEVCEGTGRGLATEGGYGKLSRNPCPCCEGDGEEPWQ